MRQPTGRAYRLPGEAPTPAPPTRGVVGGGVWQIGHVSGIEIAIDHSWILIAALIMFSLSGHFAGEYPDWGKVQTWSVALVTSVLFFASIVLHELGHSLTAQRLGVRVRSITLFVFGGVARLDSEPKRPRDEVVIAAAGPLVSLALALLFGAMADAVAAGAGGGSPSEMFVGMMTWLGRINWGLVLFNCLPGFPLDGGRVLRGIVWALTGSFERATRYAAASGSFFAYALILLGVVIAIGAQQIVSGVWMAFIGWFLLSAARSSVGQLVVERVLSHVRALQLAEPITDACIAGSTSVEALVTEAVLRRGLRTFYVVDSQLRLLGLVSLRELSSVDPVERATTRADRIMRPVDELVVLDPEETGWAAFRRMAEHGVNQLPVVQDGRLLGAVTRERLLALVQSGLVLQRARA